MSAFLKFVAVLFERFFSRNLYSVNALLNYGSAFLSFVRALLSLERTYHRKSIKFLSLKPIDDPYFYRTDNILVKPSDIQDSQVFIFFFIFQMRVHPYNRP